MTVTSHHITLHRRGGRGLHVHVREDLGGHEEVGTWWDELRWDSATLMILSILYNACPSGVIQRRNTQRDEVMNLFLNACMHAATVAWVSELSSTPLLLLPQKDASFPLGSSGERRVPYGRKKCCWQEYWLYSTCVVHCDTVRVYVVDRITVHVYVH